MVSVKITKERGKKLMAFTVAVFLITITLMILSVLFFPKIKIKKITLPTYVLVTFLGALLLLVTCRADLKTVLDSLTSNTAVNPIKILVLFISMSGLSIFLDELGFFKYLASVTLKRAKNGQIKLFLYLYVIVSVLTVFTSNDVIVLSFTPFICHFAKNAKINATPYLCAEFVGANTWSMALIIGNPTNVYLATSYGIDFLTYLSVMLIPTLISGIVAFILLLLLFYKQLKKPICCDSFEEVHIKDKPLLTSGIIHLVICTCLLAVSSYASVEMWLISLIAFISLILTSLIVSKLEKTKPTEVFLTFKHLPYELLPFILSMFVFTVALNQNGITNYLSNFLGTSAPTLKYGFASFFACNLINNIPMSILFSSILSGSGVGVSAVYATIIGSNLGAFFTPIGALAGIMWSNVLNKNGIKFSYLSFLKLGVTVALPTLTVALLSLYLTI